MRTRQKQLEAQLKLLLLQLQKPVALLPHSGWSCSRLRPYLLQQSQQRLWICQRQRRALQQVAHEASCVRLSDAQNDPQALSQPLR